MLGLGMRMMGAVSLLACGTATAAPRTQATNVTSAPSQVQGDWEKLGTREVDGKNDHDTITVGRADGRFKAIQIKVDGSKVEMFEIKITFGDGQKFEPTTRLVFDKNTTSRVIDLPGDKRVIQKVEFRYGNLPGGGKAHVELWAKD